MILLFLFGALAMVDPQEQGASGFPLYLQQLPLNDREVVLWPMAISAGLTLLVGIAISVFILGPFAQTWWLGPYLAANACLLQTTSWLPMRRPELRSALSLALVVSTVSGPVMVGLDVAKPLGLAVGFLVVLVFSMGLSVRGVARARHGLALVGSPDRADYRIPSSPPFRTPVATQQWLEARQNGKVMGVLTVMLLVLFGGISLFSLIEPSESLTVLGARVSTPLVVLASLALTVPPFFGYGGCCGSEKDNLAKDRSLVPFLALRPLTNLQIIEAKIRMTVSQAARLSLLTLAAAMLILCLPVEIDGHRQCSLLSLLSVMKSRDWIGFLALYVFVVLEGIKASISNIWCALGRLPGWALVVLGMTPLGILAILILRLVTHPGEIPTAIAWLPNVVFALAALKLAVLVPATIHLRRRRLVPVALLIKWFAGCSIAGVTLYVAAAATIPAAQYGRAALAAQVFAFLPLARMALAPTFVHRGRHQ